MMSRTRELLGLAAGVFVTYLTYAYLQELMFQLGMKDIPWFITFMQFIWYAMLSKLEIKWRNIPRSLMPLKNYFFIAVLTVGTMACSNASLKYLNYPTHVIFKSCKLIPVMIGGMLIQRKVYGYLDFSASALICLGLIVFTLANVEVSAKYDPYGVAIISTALCFDAIIGNTQEKQMKAFKISNTEMVHYSYLIGSFYLFLITLLNGELKIGLTIIANQPLIESQVPVMLFSVCGYVGISFVLSLVTSFGALTAVTVTNCRKVFTVIVSFIFFPKPWSNQYLLGGALVAAGIALSIYSKNRPKPTVLPFHKGARLL